jgi:predicted DCC family thiol-disulfide oxidoreductase YuxK
LVVLLSRFRPGEIIGKWKRYWFRPTSLGYLAITRIVCVGLQLWLLVTRVDYNWERFRTLSVLPNSVYDPLPLLRLFLLPWGDARPSYEAAITVHVITFAVGALAFLGFKTNASLLIFATGNTFLMALSYSFGDLHHPEALMIMTLWALALSPAGRALSLDDVISKGAAWSRAKAQCLKKSRFATWPLLTAQFLIAIIYLDAAVRKLWWSGLDWVNGYTLQYYLINDGISKGSQIAVWLGQQHTVAWVLSWMSLVFEATFFLVLFWPSLLWLYLPLGAGFHIGNGIAGVAWFPQFLAAYVVFLPQLVTSWGKLAPRVRSIFRLPFGGATETSRGRILGTKQPENQGAPEHPLILFDGVCNLCNGWVQFVIRRDPRGRFLLAPLQSAVARQILQKHNIQSPALDSMVVVDGGVAYTKSDAVLRITGLLPGLWPATKMFTCVPRFVRDWLYDVVAGNRYRWFGKTECLLPSGNVLSRFVDGSMPRE